MLIIEKGLGDHLPDETQFTYHSYDPADENPLDGEVETIRVHPWDRTAKYGEPDAKVYVSVQFGASEGVDNYQSIIVPRDEFVTGVLAVFPELQRRTPETGGV